MFHILSESLVRRFCLVNAVCILYIENVYCERYRMKHKREYENVVLLLRRMEPKIGF